MNESNSSKIIIQRLRLNEVLQEEMHGLNVSDITLAQLTHQRTLDVDRDLDNPKLPKAKFNTYQRAFVHICDVLKNYGKDDQA